VNISVIGLGYVGLVTSACLAEWGHSVTGADTNQRRLASLESGEMPFHEPGLGSMVVRNVEQQRLRFTASAVEAATAGDIVVVTVGTHDGNGGWQTQTMHACLQQIVPAMQDGATLVVRSTLPPEFIHELPHLVQDIRAKAGRIPVPTLLNPEFTREGCAIGDFMRPERVVVGTVRDPGGHGLAALREMYAAVSAPILAMTAMDAAFAKLGSNLFLATKISFANELAALCDAYGARVDNVVSAMGHDRRIGPSFLHAGVGFGGSCLPQQVSMTVRDARREGVDSPLLEAVDLINHRQRAELVRRLDALLGSIEGHRVAVLGLAFKPHTDDLRDAPALTVASGLIAAGAEVVAFDPMPSARAAATELVPGLRVTDDPYAAMNDASAVALLTEWPELLELDWTRAARIMRRPIMFDGRNALDPDLVQNAGFAYSAFGRMVAARQDSRLHAVAIMDGVRQSVMAALDQATSAPAPASAELKPIPAA
jgi:UDPglucose 6-dehydrogenase